jgi:hypothetical protein
LSFLRVHMLDCVEINGAPLYQIGFERGFCSEYLSPGSSWGDGQSGSACLSKQIPELVNQS